MSKFYAVKNGRIPGVYTNWEDTKAQVDGFKGAVYKSFTTEIEAQNFVSGSKIAATSKTDSIITDKPFAFVDGSFNLKTNTYGYGGFISVGGVETEISGSGNNPEMAKMRNVAGEIMGCVNAAKKAIKMGLKQLVIYYDYMGVEFWATGAWKCKKEGTQQYHDTITSLMKKIDVTFVHIYGHTGIDGNERADILAKKAVGIRKNNEKGEKQ